nr:hypothetical protein [Bacteroidota bacterium]
MKNVILLPLIFSILSLNAQTQFQKTVGTTAGDRNYHLTSMPDGGLVATGYTNAVVGKMNEAFLVKYSRFGEVEWAKTYGGNANETTWDVISTQNGEIIAAGYTSSISTFEAGLVTRSDAVGNVIWSKGINSSNGNVNFYRVMETSTGHIVATGLASLNNQDDIVICKFTASGNLLWSKIVGSPQDDEIMGMIETAQGDYLFAGLSSDANGNGGSDFAVVKTDANGNVIWKKLYGSAGSERLNAVLEHNNGYYFTGWVNPGSLGGNDVVVMKTDTAGNLDWAFAYGTPMAERVFNMVFDSSQNSIVVAGYTDYSDPNANNRNSFLMSINLAGTMNWAKSYGSSGTDGHWPTGL